MVRYHGNSYVAKMVEKELLGKKDNGTYSARPLTMIARDAIRGVLAAQKRDIRSRVLKLEIPKSLQRFLTTLEWEE